MGDEREADVGSGAPEDTITRTGKSIRVVADGMAAFVVMHTTKRGVAVYGYGRQVGLLPGEFVLEYLSSARPVLSTARSKHAFQRYVQ